jgi:Cys-tRNA(Pro)/Cys-tRNA(Cys) deacylase
MKAAATKSQAKTNAVRLLDEAGIAYRLAAYEVDEADLSAETVASKIGLPPDQVFKTLAIRAEPGGVLLALIAAGTELDLKALAAASGSKRCELLPLKEVLPVTGYVRGGVSPLGTKKRLQVFLDRAALAHAEVSISAGVRGTQILLAPDNLVRITHALLGDFHQSVPEEEKEV